MDRVRHLNQVIGPCVDMLAVRRMAQTTDQQIVFSICTNCQDVQFAPSTRVAEIVTCRYCGASAGVRES